MTITSRDVKDWFHEETKLTLTPIHEKARKLFDEMERRLEEIMKTSKMLFENSKKEIEKQNKKTHGRARALNKLARTFIKRMRQIKVPVEVTYIDFHDFNQQCQKAFVATEVDIRNWFPRISPYFILDRRKFQGVFEKAKGSLKELQTFLKEEYNKTRDLEETFRLIDDLLAEEEKLASLKAHEKKIRTTKTMHETRITETTKNMRQLRNRESLSQIGQIDIEIQKLEKEVKRSLRHFQKPFLKLQRLAFREGGLTPTELEELRHYIKNPFNTFAAEEEGYPYLKKILQAISGSIANGKLNLKHSRKQKAKEDIDNILSGNSLKDLQQRCRRALSDKRQITTSAETERTWRRLDEIEQDLKTLRRRKKQIELEERSAKKNLQESVDKIQDQKTQIEKNVFAFIGKRILIDLKV